jgi:hypothetical protein
MTMGEDTIHGLWKYIEYLTTKGSDVPHPTKVNPSTGRLGKTKKQRKAEKKAEKRRQRMLNDECRGCAVDDMTAEVEAQAEKDIAEIEALANTPVEKKRSIDTYTVTFNVTLPQGSYAGFLDTLKKAGFTQIEITRTAYLESNTKKACPMGYRGRSYPYCGYKTCSYFNHHDGCTFYGTTRRGAW